MLRRPLSCRNIVDLRHHSAKRRHHGGEMVSKSAGKHERAQVLALWDTTIKDSPWVPLPLRTEHLAAQSIESQLSGSSPWFSVSLVIFLLLPLFTFHLLCGCFTRPLSLPADNPSNLQSTLLLPLLLLPLKGENWMSSCESTVEIPHEPARALPVIN